MVQVRALLETASLDQDSFASWLTGLAIPLDALDQTRLIDALRCCVSRGRRSLRERWIGLVMPMCCQWVSRRCKFSPS